MTNPDILNPFDDDEASFIVLVNEEGQQSLWPATADVPAGWTIVHSSDTRTACLAYIDNNWIDMRPNSLKARMEPKS